MYNNVEIFKFKFSADPKIANIILFIHTQCNAQNLYYFSSKFFPQNIHPCWRPPGTKGGPLLATRPAIVSIIVFYLLWIQI